MPHADKCIRVQHCQRYIAAVQPDVDSRCKSFVPMHQGWMYCAEVSILCNLQVQDFRCSHRCTASTAQAPQALHRQQECLSNMLTVYSSAKSVQAILPISSIFISSSHPCSVIMNALPCCVLISPALPRMLNTTSLASACKTTRRVCLAATDVHYDVCMPPFCIVFTMFRLPASYAARLLLVVLTAYLQQQAPTDDSVPPAASVSA